MMVQFVFIDNPSPDALKQILKLYKLAEWWGGGNQGLNLVERIVLGSHCFLVVIEMSDGQEKVIGMGRAISDGVSDAYIQDVTVLSSYRKRNIGTRIVEKLIERLETDGIGWIGLIAEKGTTPFYENMGFKKMTNASPMLKVVK